MIQMIAAEGLATLAENTIGKEVVEDISKKAFSETSLKLSPNELLSKSDEIGMFFDDASIESILKETASNNYNDTYYKVLNGEMTYEDLTAAYTQKIEAFKETYINNSFAGIEKNGITFSEYGFPEFDAILETDIPLEDYNSSRGKHFSEANKQLSEAIANDPELAKRFSERQLEQIKLDATPDGFTWHHDGNPPPGRLQLVDTVKHDEVRHHGGFSQIQTRE